MSFLESIPRYGKIMAEGVGIPACKNTLTIAEIYGKLTPLVGKVYTLPTSTNKGLPGQFLEDLLGIPHTSDCLDVLDGELKIFPVKKLKNGTLVPKETMAITMLSQDELIKCEFSSSKCYKKMSRMLVVPYYRDGETIQYMSPKIIDRRLAQYKDLYSTLKSDYDSIRKNYLDSGELHSETGELLQNRTKGVGHGSTSRAFYLRPKFMKSYVPLSL